MTTNNTGKKRPTHAIWQVIDGKEKSRWIRVGAAWSNRDGQGLTLVFDSYPVVGRIQVREFSEQQPEDNGSR